MTAFRFFTRRNMQNYFRDKACVFFSLLSMLILIMLMVFFLGDMYSKEMGDVILAVNPTLDSQAVADGSADFIRLWTLGGVLSINAVTITMMVMSSIVRDESEKKTHAFYSAPVRRSVLTMSYIFSSWIITLIMSSITLGFSEIFLAICGSKLLGLVQILKLLGLIAAYSIVAACIAYLIAMLVHSMGAWSGILTLVGTLIGFAAGCYIPISNLTGSLQTVLKFLPFLHGAAAMRSVCVESAADIFQGIPAEVLNELNIQLGNTVIFKDHTFALSEQLLIFLAYAILAVGIAVLVTKNRRLKAQ